MYRVVLIDDEAVILEGLKRVVKWENYDCQVVGRPLTPSPATT